MSEVNYLKTFLQRKGANVFHAKECRFIEGERPYGANPYCGKKADPGCSYCKKHRAICLVPVNPITNRSFCSHAEFIARTSR